MRIHDVRDPSGPSSASFLAEVRDFCDSVGNPALTPEERKRALGLIVTHAGALDPADPAFACAGVALKDALCSWLDAQPKSAH